MLASLPFSLPCLPQGLSHPAPTRLGTVRTGLPGIRSLQVGGLHCPGREGTEDEAHVFVGQCQRSLRPPCEKKNMRLGILQLLLCHSRLQSSGAVSPLHSQRNTSFSHVFPPRRPFFHHWSSQTCLFRTQESFLRRVAHFSALSVLHFVKSPRPVFVDATHGPVRHSQRTATSRTSDCLPTSLRIFPAHPSVGAGRGSGQQI